MRRLGIVLLLAVALPTSLAAPALAGGHAHLTLKSADPVTVHGAGFHRRERVRVVVRRGSGAAVTRRLRASRTGAFSARFDGLSAGACGRLSVTATGRGGSHAVLPGVLRPDCIVD